MSETFINPYKGCEKQETAVRMQTFIDENDYQFIRLLRIKSGTVTITVNTLFKKLIEELKKRGINDITKQKDFEAFVAKCVIALPEELKK